MKRVIALTMVMLTSAALPQHTSGAERNEALADQETPVFEKHIRPILKAHCFHCHGEAGKTEGGLDVRLRRLILKGGESGAGIAPGKPSESYLLERIISSEMPPGDAKLSAAEVATIERWIETDAQTARPEPEAVDGPLITEEERNFWAFRPIGRPAVPPVQHTELVATPVDAFLLEKLEARGFAFSPLADKETLIRRATFDLIGLPPTPAEVEAFLADESPLAYEKLLDRLLESPQYGERWGRHWLDVAGYADSEGYTEDDPVRLWAYKYRDYVVRSLNANKPFDQFIHEQLAGDEMVPPPYKNLTPEQAEKLIATGFLRMAADGTAASGVNQVEARNQVVADTLQIVSTSLLGLTVGCAQCHDHRYDPIPQTDYYHFRAIFEPAFNVQAWRVPNARRVSLYTDDDRQRAAEIEEEAKQIDAERLKKQDELTAEVFERELAKLPAEMRDAARSAYETPVAERTAEQKALLKKYPSVDISPGKLRLYDSKAAQMLQKYTDQANDIRKQKPQEEYIRALTEIPGQVPDTFLFYRGDPTQPREKLVPAGLTVLRSESSAEAIPGKDESLPTSGRRLAYARRLTDPSHPLTSRVLVNRFWLHHFGRGIVATPGDFGMLGARPTHPELLDWLASEFMQTGWDLKRFHKLLMTSYAYRQQLRSDARQDEADPDNTLYGGMRLRRLEAEVVRDAVLAISGKLNLTSSGKPVPVMADRVGQYVLGIENLNAGRPGAIVPLKGQEFRRSLYVQARRSRPLAMLDAFDLPRMEPNCESRASSTVAPQSLMLMNNDFVLEQAEHFAQRVASEAGEEAQAQVSLAWQLAFNRRPSEQEVAEAAAFLAEQATHFEQNQSTRQPDKTADKNLYQPGLLAPKLQALASFCQILISSNEFLYVD